jgi:hypothetical protein
VISLIFLGHPSRVAHVLSENSTELSGDLLRGTVVVVQQATHALVSANRSVDRRSPERLFLLRRRQPESSERLDPEIAAPSEMARAALEAGVPGQRSAVTVTMIVFSSITE